MTDRRWALAAGVGAVLLRLQAPALAAEPADLVIHGGKVVTMDDAGSIRSAVAVKDGKILAVGGEELATRYSAPEVIDLQGRTLTPGFMDTHVHVLGVSRRFIDLRDVKSIADLQARIAAKAKELGPGEWITGANGMIFNLAEKRRPDKRDLDKAAPDNPVAVQFNHASYGNSLALKIAGIGRDTPQPERGFIEKGDDGEPNGVIRERGDLYTVHIPPEKAEELKPSFEAELRRFTTMGVTSVIIPGTPLKTPPERRGGRLLPSWPELQALYAEEGEVLPRAAAMIEWPGAEALKAFPHKTGDGDERLRLGGIGEMGLDGGLTGPAAWMLRDYKSQPGFSGRAKFTREEYQANVDLGARLGWQFGVHAIGDAALKEAVEVFDEALRKYPHPDHRWYMGHFNVMPPEATLALMAKDHIWIGAQPNFEYALEPQYDQVLQSDQMRNNNPVATPVKRGLFVAFGSDNIPIGPTVGLYAAVTRKGVSGKVYGPEEAVSAYDALKMYTRNGPYFTWEEKIKGTLEPGKLADMIVLDRDPLTVPPEQLLKMQVDLTIIGGKVVYDRAKGLTPLPR